MATASINLTEQANALLLLPMFESLTEEEIRQLAGLLIAAFGGSWPFIILFGSFLVTWMLLNTFIALKRTGNPVDPNGSFDVYPFIALNLVLSMISAFQAPIIMMSQNRSGEKDRLAAENDYKVNLKSELMLEELTRRMERLQNEQMEELLSTARLTKVIRQQPVENHRKEEKAVGVK